MRAGDKGCVTDFGGTVSEPVALGRGRLLRAAGNCTKWSGGATQGSSDHLGVIVIPKELCGPKNMR